MEEIICSYNTEWYHGVFVLILPERMLVAFLHFLEWYFLTHYECENHLLKKRWFVQFLFMVNVVGLYQNVEIRDTHTNYTGVKVIAHDCSFLFLSVYQLVLQGFD